MTCPRPGGSKAKQRHELQAADLLRISAGSRGIPCHTMNGRKDVGRNGILFPCRRGYKNGDNREIRIRIVCIVAGMKVTKT